MHVCHNILDVDGNKMQYRVIVTLSIKQLIMHIDFQAHIIYIDILLLNCILYCA
jgi:mRNA-degrading endonuclease HigB of HigAB toxin-antitoxin module